MKTTFEKLWEERVTSQQWENWQKKWQKINQVIKVFKNIKSLNEETNEKKLKEFANQIGLGERELSYIRNGIEDKDGNPEADHKDICGS